MLKKLFSLPGLQGWMGGDRPTAPPFYDIEAAHLGQSVPTVYERLKAGQIVVIRNVPEILAFRDTLIDQVGRLAGTTAQAEIQDYLNHKSIPSVPTLHTFTTVLKHFREVCYLSALLADRVTACGFPAPITLDGGIYRLVFPSETTDSLRYNSALFQSSDFARERADGPTETFMLKPAPPHRDLNRSHYTFQANFWIPLHDSLAEESLLIFPDVYHEPVLPQNLDHPDPSTWGLGHPLKIALKAGDLIAFHGEHYHGSPVVQANTVRFSYDFRIAAQCYDDNSTYRYNFWNLNNFLPASTSGVTGFSVLPANQRANFLTQQATMVADSPVNHFNEHSNQSIAQLYSVWLSNPALSNSTDWLIEIKRLFDNFPFAEDRYIALAEIVKETDIGLASDLIALVLSRTESYFWAMKCGDLALALSNQTLAKDAFQKTQALANTTTVSFSLNPVEYNPVISGPCLQLLPDRAFEMASRQLVQLDSMN